MAPCQLKKHESITLQWKNQPIWEKKIHRRSIFTCGRRDGILKEQRPDAVRTYTYNAKNQQTQVELEDGTVQTNSYDPEGLRHEMEENGKLLRFVYHKGELVYERGETEQTGTSYHQGAGTEALNRAGKIYYYHKDEQLSTALITDETGTVSNCYRYDAFGNILDSVEQIENRIRYTGQQYDGITGQYYLRARYYNPAVGRFMQEDTYRGDGLNLYAYCANNPVTYYDPRGYAGTSSYVAADGGDGGEGILPKPGEPGFVGPLEEVDAARAANWVKPDGSTWWPPNGGAVPGTEQMIELPKGTEFGRIGGENGSYVAPPKTPPEKLALKPGTDTSIYNEYRVVNDIPGVEQAEVAGWFDMPGGGTQYKLPASVKELSLNGYIELIDE